MKILVIQIARFGDIYMSWPALRAIKRVHPSAELHLLVRSKFVGATRGLEAVDRVIEFDSAKMLRPLIEGENVVDSMIEARHFVEKLKLEKYTHVYNLSFSPISSFLTYAIGEKAEVVHGYTRHADGFLAIPDDTSAYFYAQVGIGRPNRVHVSQLLGLVADVELEDQDWQGRSLSEKSSVNFSLSHVDFEEESTIVVHVGASEQKKVLQSSQWAELVGLLQKCTSSKIVLVGVANERVIGEAIVAQTGILRVDNRVGETSFSDLFRLISAAKLLIGCDSAPVHIASLVGTPVLNVSFGVNPFETGPRSRMSRIVRFHDRESVNCEYIAREAISLLEDDEPQDSTLVVSHPTAIAEAEVGNHSDEWEMARAVYMGAPFPIIQSASFNQALHQLVDLNELAIQQIALLQVNKENKTASEIIDRVDQVMSAVAEIVPELGVVIRWFMTEKIRLGPRSIDEIFSRTIELHQKLGQVLSVYANSGEGESTDAVRDIETGSGGSYDIAVG